MRFVRNETIDVVAPREQVFALVCRLSESPTDSGNCNVTLVSSTPPHHAVLECLQGNAAYRWTFDLTTSPTGTTVHQTVERLGSGLARVWQPFTWELSQCGRIRAVLQQLKGRAELQQLPQPRQEGAPSRQLVP
jgi:hypothetical protein